MLSVDELTKAATRLKEAKRVEAERLDLIHGAVRGDNSNIYVPRSASTEFRELVRQAQFNVLPLVVTSLAQALYVDGYRPSGSLEDSPVWDAVWQPNRMDARQAGLYRAAIEYGVSYALVLPGRMTGADGAQTRTPVIRPLSPRRCTALYDDPMVDEWPELAMVSSPRRKEVTVYDDQWAYPMTVGDDSTMTPARKPEEHGLGVPPVVRFWDSYGDLDDGPMGKIEPLIPVQRQLNQTTYSLLMAQEYSAFRQRWVTGMAIPEDENGIPIEPFNAAVDRVWHAESPDTKFGDFAQTDLNGYLNSRDKGLLYISSVAQIPPHALLVGPGVSNISAEALAALEAGHRQDIAEHQSSFGESMEQTMRLAALAMGDMETWGDTSAQVVWRDTTPRSIAQVADALGKLATQLAIPPKGLWSRIPGATQQDLADWEAMAAQQDVLAELSSFLNTDQEVEDAGAGGEPADEGVPSTPA